MAKRKDLTVADIVEMWLIENGYDGLYQEESCACLATDLAPCCDNGWNCFPGVLVRCNPETCEQGGECRFHIGPKDDPDKMTCGERQAILNDERGSTP
jgi:hypothetical protein